MIHRISTVFLFVLGLALAACGGAASEPPPSTPATPSAPATPSTAATPSAAGPSTEATTSLKAPGEAAVGDRTTCPVSGEEFTVAESSPHAEYNGKTYFFCCSGCKGKFEANPEQFLKKN